MPSRQLGSPRLEAGAALIHPSRTARAPEGRLRAVLRLTGLPAPARYPKATVRQSAGLIEIVFSGDEGATAIDVDPRQLGPVEDLETAVLDLLARLQAQGYDARLERAPQSGIDG
jgi:hypothetical protein